MNKIKAAIYSGIEKIGIQEVDWIKPEPGYIVLDTKQTGICGKRSSQFLWRVATIRHAGGWT